MNMIKNFKAYINSTVCIPMTFFMVGFGFSCWAQHTTITIDQNRIYDASIRSTVPNGNGGNIPMFRASGWTESEETDNFRSLIKFDLYGFIPVGHVVTSAIITFKTDLRWSEPHEINFPGTHSNEVYLEKVTGYWHESGVTWNNQPPTTTEDRVFVSQSLSVYETKVIDITEFVQDFVDNPSSNYGFMMKLVDESPFAARNYGTTENYNYAPEITITFYDPAEVDSFPYKEGFESTSPRWKNESHDQLDWISGSGTTPSAYTGPSEAVEGNYYYYLEATDNNNKSAQLTSPMYDLTLYHYPILSFYYHMNGADMGSLRFYAKTHRSSSYLSLGGGKIEGNRGDEWHKVEIPLQQFSHFGDSITLALLGTTGAGDQSDIAIDGIELISNLQNKYIFSFDTGLEWHNTIDGEAEWQINFGETVTENTGPSMAYEGDVYAYLTASSPNEPDKVGILESHLYDLSLMPDPFLSFYYHMFGATMGELAVDISTDYRENWTNLWSVSGDQGNVWYKEYIDLTSYKDTPVFIRFRGTTGSNFYSDIAIDFVEIGSPAKVTIPDSNFEQALIDLNLDVTLDGWVYEYTISGIDSLDISNKNISTLEGIASFASLVSLNTSYNQLDTLDVSTLVSLQNLNVSNNHLTGLNPSNNNLLKTLNASNNQITALDLSNNSMIQSLMANGNNLTTLDLLAQTSLASLQCNDNYLVGLELTSNTALAELNISNNQLIELDISPLVNLNSFDATGNAQLYCIQIFQDQDQNISDASQAIDVDAEYSIACPILAQADGNWNDLNVWPGGVIPGDGDRVRIIGASITLDQFVQCESVIVEHKSIDQRGQLFINSGGYLELTDYLKVVENMDGALEKNRVIVQEGGHLKVLGNEQ